MNEEAILGGLRSGEDLPDYDYEEFEAGSAGQRRRGDDPERDTPRSRGRYTDDGDDRIFRQATDDEQGRGARPDRGGSESGFDQGHLDFISMAMMARPHTDDLGRSPRSLFQVNHRPRKELRTRDHGLGSAGRSTGSQNPGQCDEHEERVFAGIGYDALLSSTAGWGGSVKPESDTDRPNPVPTTPIDSIK